MSARGYEALRQELRPGERLIWGGYPRQGIHVRTGWAIFTAVIVIIDVLVVMMTATGLVTPAPGIIVVLVFATIVVCFIVIDGISDALRRRYTLYGLTDRRAIVISGMLNRSERSVRLVMMTTVELIERPDHIGTIRCISRADNWLRMNRRKEIKPIPLFRAIVDPRHVHDLLVEGTGFQPTHRVTGNPVDPASRVRFSNGPELS